MREIKIGCAENHAVQIAKYPFTKERFYATVCKYGFSRHSESGYSDRPLMTGGLRN